MRSTLVRVGLALYVAWLGAVVVHAGSWLGVVPRFDLIHRTVVAGAVVATVVGALQLLRRFYAVVSGYIGRNGGI